MSIYARDTAYLRFILFLTLLSFACSGCAKVPPSGKTALKVNDYTLSAAEFDELFLELEGEEDTPVARKAFVENLINRKVLLQEAQNEGLDKQKEFLKAIENFWEQSLLTIVIDKKTRELSDGIAVTEDEIQDYYSNLVSMYPEMSGELDYKLRNTIRLQLIKKKQADAVNSWAESLRQKARIEADNKALGIELE